MKLFKGDLSEEEKDSRRLEQFAKRCGKDSSSWVLLYSGTAGLLATAILIARDKPKPAAILMACMFLVLAFNSYLAIYFFEPFIREWGRLKAEVAQLRAERNEGKV